MNGGEATERQRPTEAVAGLVAAASIAASLIGLAYRPIRIIPFAIFFALLAAAVGGRYSRLATVAVFVGSVCFVVGTTVAVVTKNPIF